MKTKILRPAAFCSVHAAMTVLISALLVLASPVRANTLLVGEASNVAGQSVPFSLSGNSREDVIGGEIVFGDQRFTITAVSEHNLVGGQYTAGDTVHLALFSSSYSRVTDSGEPWAAGAEHHGCEQAYNSFLALYKVPSADIGKLPDPPYWPLAEGSVPDTGSVAASGSSSIYCFMSQPADR